MYQPTSVSSPAMEPLKSRRRRRRNKTHPSTSCMYATVLQPTTLKKPFNKHAFKHTMRRLWRRKTSRHFSITSLHPNLFLVRFAHPLDRSRVLHAEPWHFDNSLVLLKALADSYTDSYIDSYRPFNAHIRFAKFWVHVHNLPPLMRVTREVRRKIGDFVGQFVDAGGEFEGVLGGKALKVRVLVDVGKPLRRVVNLRLGDGEEMIWGSLKYERLPNFCYFCGRLDHVLMECEECGVEGVLEEKGKLGFGDWMRVKDDEPRKRLRAVFNQSSEERLSFEGDNGDDHDRDSVN